MKNFSTPFLVAALSCPEIALPKDADAQPEGALTFEAAYAAEGWRNLRGGQSRDGAYLDNLDLVATLDADRIGLDGTTIAVAALYNNRATFSDKVGDLQTISNIDTDGAARLYEAWIERRFTLASFKLGLMDLNAEFDANETGSLFINSSHGIGPDFSQIGETGPSIFPITGLGARVVVGLAEGTRVRVGAFEGTPGDPDDPRRNAFHLDDDEGHLFVAQMEQELGDRGLVAAGLWRHTGRSAVLGDEDTVARNDSSGGYVLIEGTLATHGVRELRGFLRAGVADADVHQISRYQGAGIALSGPLFSSGQREEQIGIAISAVSNGGPFRRMRHAAGAPVDSHEIAIELTYRVQLTPALALQPDVQYIVNPGTEPPLRNALAVGLRISWGASKDALRPVASPP